MIGDGAGVPILKGHVDVLCAVDKAIEFSRFIIQLSADLWSAFPAPITNEAIPRLLKGVDRDGSSFARSLMEAMPAG